jgi:hypothetical protein
MRKRLYFLLPDISSTRLIVDELLLARIDDHHIHVLANEHTPLHNLPRANLLQTSDIIHGIEQGLIIGGVTGLVGGIVATIALSLGTMIGGVILASTLAGALFGLWVSGMIGSNIRNSCLKRFEQAIEDGQILLMIDVPSGRTREISRMIRAHKESREGGVEPSLPAFP